MLKSQLGCVGGLAGGAAGDATKGADNPLGQLGGLFKKKKP
jgi:hypothetical protein